MNLKKTLQKGFHLRKNLQTLFSWRVIVFFVCSAVLVLTAVYWMQTKTDISQAENEINAVIRFVEEQCLQYDNLLQMNHVRSQVSTIDSATELARDIFYDEDAMSRDRLVEFIAAQRLEGVIVLDENLKPVVEAEKNSNYGYSFWSDVFSRQAVKNVLKEKKVAVVNHFQVGLDNYCYAVVPRQDQKGVIFCYSQEASVAATYDGDSLENLLVGYKIDKNGTVALTNGEKVISANDASMQGQKIENCPRIMMFNEKWIPDRLVRVTKNNQAFYGIHVKCNQYYIYVFFPANRIFEGRTSTMAYAVCIFLGIWAVILLNRQHSEAKYQNQLLQSNQSLQETVNILESLNNIYFTSFYVDLAADSYRCIFLAPWLASMVPQEGKYTDLVELLIQNTVLEEHREKLENTLNAQYICTSLHREALSEVRRSYYVDYQSVRKGETKWCRVTVIVVDLDETGAPRHVLAVLQDIGEQKEQEMAYQNQILQSAQDARQANAAKTEFLRRMSHDIRTPINGILGMLDIAEHFPDDADKQKECRRKIRSASLFLFDLVNDVLDMSKMESGNIKIEEIPFQLEDSISEVASLTEVQAVEQGIQFSVDIPKQTHWNVVGSPLHLRQILLNVASNAVKYNRKNGSVHLSCREVQCEKGSVWFEFVCEDTGLGMSDEFQKKMFEPFTQENDSARTTFNGTGLGLSIVKKLVDMMGGDIQVQSTKNVGSKFTITLPFRLQPLKEDAKENADSAKKLFSLQGAKVMLVEDNALNMEIAQFTLENEGAEVVRAWNGEEAVELFAHSAPGEYDVILMDIMMPVMDGITATGKIRKLEREDAATIPIIAMTANAFSDDIEKNKAAGMNAQLSKPLQVDKLIRVITEYMH